MIQFNLLPDVKLQYVKARQFKHAAVFTTILISGISLVIFLVLLLYVDVAQKQHLSGLNRDISTNSAQLVNDSNFNKIITIQNQLNSLPALESQRPVVTRLFGYITGVTPATANISTLSASYIANTMSISGHADKVSTVNEYVDTLKFTTYTILGSSNSPVNAFSSIVLADLSVNSSSSSSPNQAVSYTISLNFDPKLFIDTDQINLNVPKQTTTRSITEQPTDLFQTPSSGTGGQ